MCLKCMPPSTQLLWWLLPLLQNTTTKNTFFLEIQLPQKTPQTTERSAVGSEVSSSTISLMKLQGKQYSTLLKSNIFLDEIVDLCITSGFFEETYRVFFPLIVLWNRCFITVRSLFSQGPALQGRKLAANLFQKKPAHTAHPQIYFPHIQTYHKIPSTNVKQSNLCWVTAW